MADPNLVISGLSQEVSVGGETLRIEIYRLEDDPGWTLEVVDRDGTSTVWDDEFDSDQAALDEALRAIQEEGPRAFHDQRNVVPFPKR